MSKHVRISESSSSERDAGDFDLYFPLFILALRDFTLDLNTDGKDISSDEYLEDCLDLLTGTSDFDIRYNTPRICIRKYFKKRKCFTFERPGTKATLKKLETLTDDDLEEEFVEDLKRFTTFIFCECPPKKLDNGQLVNGRMFATLTQTYVSAIRNGIIPCIESALETMAHTENTKAVEASVTLYVTKMKATLQLPVPVDKELSNAHQTCMKDAITLFLKRAVYDRDQQYQKLANERMNNEYETFKKENEQASDVKSKQAIAQLSLTIEEKIKHQLYTRAGGYSIYQQDIMKIKDEYEKLNGLGCKKQETLLKYLERKWVEGQTILQVDQQITEREKEAEIEKQKAIAADIQRVDAERFAKIQRQRFEDEKLQMEENIKQLEEKQQQELKNLMDHQTTVLNERVKEQERLLKEGFNIEAARLRQDIENLRQQNAKARKQRSCCIQ